MSDIDLKLVQVFLSQSSSIPAVFEVSARKDHSLHCTCPGYSSKNTCKHTRFVKARIDHNDGIYPMEISNKASHAEMQKAQESNKDFREFILKFGKVEVF